MALDPNKLSRNELVQLLNSTALGESITRSRLDRQMNRSGRRWHDGRRIRLLEYLRWLIREVDRPAKPKIDARAADLERKNTETWRTQNIAPLPDIADMTRRERARADFRFFCETYFASALYRGWSEDHLRVIEKIERAVKEGGLFAFAMPRGSGKTTLARLSALWAILSGYRPFVCLIGGSQERAVELLAPIRKAVLENPLLLADFPTAIYPLHRLQNNARRQIGQHIDGRPTYCTWAADKLVFPTVEGPYNEASGAIITVTSLDANMRGQQHTTMDGRTLRPSLVLLDDPQTRQSARSPSQTRYRLQLLTGDVLGMAGPGESIAAVLTCTKIYAGDLADQVLDRQKTPEWQGECTKLVYAFPTAEKLWDEYARVRAEGLRQGKGLAPATEFYAAHREAMDAGAVVAWPARYDAKTELSAIQHAMNLKLRDEEAFAAEYQNEPATEQFEDKRLTADQVAEKITGRPRGEVPLAATRLTAFIDVHDKLLYWCVCAWEEDFTGYVIDYGTFPDQKRQYFTLRDATHTLAAAFRGAGKEGAVQAGLEKLASELLARPWTRTDGAALCVERMLIDSGYLPAVCNAVAVKLGPAVLLSKGMGLRAGNKPMAAYTRRPGERHGHNWYIPNVSRSSEFRHVAFDANFWKTFLHARLATLAGDKGSLSLFGKKPEHHRLFAEHVADAETYVVTEGQGRTVHEWRVKPSKPDNHWFDCLVGCTVAASMIGAKVPGEGATTRQRKRYTQEDLRRRVV